MQLIDMREEVLATGFDPVGFGSARINNYINNAYFNLCRRVDYYIDETSVRVTTVTGAPYFAFPAGFARARSLVDTDRDVEIVAVGLRQVDRSSATSGAPTYYALNGSGIELFPTPDGVYNLLMRYWKLPTALAVDTDVPTIPPDYHNLLIYSANAECYRAEDDHATAAAWQALYDKGLAEFSADVKFANDDAPNQISDMWTGAPSLSGRGWSIYGSGF